MAAGGTADFFYRESLRLGYVARSAFKVSSRVHPESLLLSLPPFMTLSGCFAAAADPDAEAAQAHRAGRCRARPRLRPRRVAPGEGPLVFLVSSSSEFAISPHFHMSVSNLLGGAAACRWPVRTWAPSRRAALLSASMFMSVDIWQSNCHCSV